MWGGCFAMQHERQVNQDNTIAVGNRILQIEKTRWRNTLAGCHVTVYELLDGTVVVRFGPHEVARFAPESLPAPQPKVRHGARPLGHKRERAASANGLRQQGIGIAPFPRFPSGGKRGAPPPPLRCGSGPDYLALV
jgi:hypothetical protein